MNADRLPMSEERAKALGLVRWHEPLSPRASEVVASVTRWHRAAGPEDWIDRDLAPLGAYDSERGRSLPLVRSLSDPGADFHFGAELALGAFKVFRLSAEDDTRWFETLHHEDGLAAVAALFDDEPSMGNIWAGFFCAVSMLMVCAVAPCAPLRAVLARLDAIDHEEAAARLECLLDGFVPVSLFDMRERFPLLARPGTWVEWVGDRP